jgi:hypothetical protein
LADNSVVESPFYIGLREKRASPEVTKAFVAEFVQAAEERWPRILSMSLSRKVWKWSCVAQDQCYFLSSMGRLVDNNRIRLARGVPRQDPKL